jgi:hypothetical protein
MLLDFINQIPAHKHYRDDGGWFIAGMTVGGSCLYECRSGTTYKTAGLMFFFVIPEIFYRGSRF